MMEILGENSNYFKINELISYKLSRPTTWPVASTPKLHHHGRQRELTIGVSSPRFGKGANQDG